MESNKRKCKICSQLKDRIYSGKYPNDRDKKWRDESGLLWMGNVCGKCNQIRAKRVMKKSRTEDAKS